MAGDAAPWSKAEIDLLREECAKGGTWVDVEDRLNKRLTTRKVAAGGLSATAHRFGIAKARKRRDAELPAASPRETIDYETGERESVITLAGLDDAARTLSEWKARFPDLVVTRQSTWQAQTPDGIAWLLSVRGRPADPTPEVDLVERLCENLAKRAPKIPTPKPRGETLCVLGLHDHHFGMRAWGKETGAEDWDTDIARRVYLNAVVDLLDRAKPYGIGRILLPIGSDFFHADNAAGTTASGTEVGWDDRFEKVFAAGEESVVRAVEKCARVAPVDIVWIKGNHDRGSSFSLARVLRAWFRNTEHVTVDAEPTPWKFVTHGKTLLGIAHGQKPKPEKLPLIMATEAADLWSQAICREWHVGHLHTRGETRHIDMNAHGGVVVRRCPSLASRDAWHTEMGYTGNRRAADAILYDHEDGYAATLTVYARTE